MGQNVCRPTTSEEEAYGDDKLLGLLIYLK
jgi:hypothetical protein